MLWLWNLKGESSGVWCKNYQCKKHYSNYYLASSFLFLVRSIIQKRLLQFLFLSWKQFCKSSYSSSVSFYFPPPELATQHLLADQFFSCKSQPLPSWGGGSRLSSKKRPVQHLGIVQACILIHSLFQDWSPCDYFLDANIPGIPYPFPAITCFSRFTSHHLYSSQTLLLNCSFWDLVVVDSLSYLLMVQTVKLAVRPRRLHSRCCIHLFDKSDCSLNSMGVIWVHQTFLSQAHVASFLWILPPIVIFLDSFFKYACNGIMIIIKAVKQIQSTALLDVQWKKTARRQSILEAWEKRLVWSIGLRQHHPRQHRY